MYKQEKAEKEKVQVEYQELKLKAEKMFNDLKVQHRSTIRSTQKRHADRIAKVKARFKSYDEQLEKCRHDYIVMLDQANHYEKIAKKHYLKRRKSDAKAKQYSRQLQQLKIYCNELKDQVKDEHKLVEELNEKVEEYDQVIEVMKAEYDEQVEEFDDVVAYMDHYYEEVVRTTTPLQIKKHRVKNEGTRGKSCI